VIEVDILHFLIQNRSKEQGCTYTIAESALAKYHPPSTTVIRMCANATNIDERAQTTRAFYQRHAAEYAAATLRAPMERFTKLFAQELSPGARVADLGCGGGRDLRLLRERGLDPIGLDSAEALAVIARQYSGASVVVGDLRSLPFGENVFGGVWASASLLHLRRADMNATLAEIFCIMRAGGVFFGSVKSGNGEAQDADGRWFTYYNRQEWTELLGQAGFQHVLVERGEIDCDPTSKLGAKARWLPTFARKL
jgi:SAM-dependent methyltransferase